MAEGENPSGRLTGGLNGRDKAITYWEDAAWVAYAHTYVSMPQFIQYTECLKKLQIAIANRTLRAILGDQIFGPECTQNDLNWLKWSKITWNLDGPK